MNFKHKETDKESIIKRHLENGESVAVIVPSHFWIIFQDDKKWLILRNKLVKPALNFYFDGSNPQQLSHKKRQPICYLELII